MDIHLQRSQPNLKSELKISGSKSETNRLLLLQALYPHLQIENESDSDDSRIMLEAINSTSDFIDVHHAGTAMRFLTAYFAMQPGREITITGSPRMQQRPIKTLVAVLRKLGADISYVGEPGFPPLLIKGKNLSGGKVSIDAGISSQYSSALLLIGSALPNGISIELEGEITSVPYIKMTLSLLNQIGIEAEFIGNAIKVASLNQKIKPIQITVESDWSSASYFYSIIALSEKGTSITLSSFKKESLQGDRILAEIYARLGVETNFDSDKITLTNTGNSVKNINLNLNDSPDIAQTIAVTCFGLKIKCELSGLQTLRIKETDRLFALQTELTKLGANLSVTQDSLTIEPSEFMQSNCSIATYNDHRMAMAFAALAVKVPIIIEDAQVVSKSYPGFWADLKRIGIRFE